MNISTILKFQQNIYIYMCVCMEVHYQQMAPFVRRNEYIFSLRLCDIESIMSASIDSSPKNPLFRIPLVTVHAPFTHSYY
jgi:hypothetical protein